MADGRTAWSQPFWLAPNAPKVRLAPMSGGMSLIGETLPGARVHISENGQYVGNTQADSQGAFEYVVPGLSTGNHDLWILSTGPWPDDVEGRPILLTVGSRDGP